MPQVFKLTEEEASQKKIPRKGKQKEPEAFVNPDFPLYTWKREGFTLNTQVRCFSITYHGEPLVSEQTEAVIAEEKVKK